MLQDKILGWCRLHTQGRAMLSLHLRHLDSPDNYRIREGEVVCTTLVGWQFGDGHLHDERIISAVQRRCSYEPGELVVVYTESQPIHRSFIHYRVIDAALGVVETGRYLGVDAERAPAVPRRRTDPVRGRLDSARTPAGRTGFGRESHVTRALVVGSGPNGLAAALVLARPPDDTNEPYSTISQTPTTVQTRDRRFRNSLPDLRTPTTANPQKLNPRVRSLSRPSGEILPGSDGGI